MIYISHFLQIALVQVFPSKESKHNSQRSKSFELHSFNNTIKIQVRTCSKLVVFFKPLVPCLLYILTSVWVLRTPNAGWNLHFQHFCAKKLKKYKKSNKFNAKFRKKFFFICTKTLVECFIPRSSRFSQTMFNIHFLSPSICLFHSVFPSQLRTYSTLFFYPHSFGITPSRIQTWVISL